MKKFTLHSTAFVLALFFFFAGMGYNYVNYCCESCKSLGIEFLTHTSCEEIHHQNQCQDRHCQHKIHPTASLAEDFSIDEKDGSSCQLTRLSVDFSKTNASIHVNIPEFQLIAILSAAPESTQKHTWEKETSFPNAPPYGNGRTLLCQNCTLLI